MKKTLSELVEQLGGDADKVEFDCAEFPCFAIIPSSAGVDPVAMQEEFESTMPTGSVPAGRRMATDNFHGMLLAPVPEDLAGDPALTERLSIRFNRAVDRL